MALARVVTFEGVNKERVAELKQQIEGGAPPGGLEATEIIALHDADTEKSIVILFFEDEDAYHAGDKVLSAMDSGDTPGTRTSITKYDVAIRATP
jgi:hypothetical protein